MSGNTLKEAVAVVANPVGSAGKALGLENNDLVKLGASLTSAAVQLEGASTLLNFKEGQKLGAELTGTKLEQDKALKKAEGVARENQAADQQLLGSARSAVDLMTPNSQQFTGQARTAAGQAELSRLLALFNQRQQDFAGSRARPGMQQTRLV